MILLNTVSKNVCVDTMWDSFIYRSKREIEGGFLTGTNTVAKTQQLDEISLKFKSP